MPTLQSTPFCTGPALDGRVGFLRGLMGASIGLAVLEVAREQGDPMGQDRLDSVGGVGAARYVLRTAQKATHGMDLRGLGDLSDLGAYPSGLLPEVASYIDKAFLGPGLASARSVMYATLATRSPAEQLTWMTQSEASAQANAAIGEDIISATIRFVAHSFSQVNPIFHPEAWFNSFKAYLRKWDITSNEGQAALGAFLDLMPFFWPLGTIVKNMGRLVQCLKSNASKAKGSNEFLGCFADLLVNSIKDIITSPYFLLVVGVLTGNAIQAGQAGLRVVGSVTAAAASANSQYAGAAAYISVGFNVAADSTDIIRICQSDGIAAARNPAVYVMLGEMLLRRAPDSLAGVKTGGIFVRDHASILAKLAGGDVNGAFTELKAKYVDTHVASVVNTVNGAVARVDAAQIQAWRGIAGGMASLAGFFAQISVDARNGGGFIAQAGAFLTRPIDALRQICADAATAVTAITRTLEQGMALSQGGAPGFTWADVVAEAKKLATATLTAAASDVTAATAEQSAQQAQQAATSTDQGTNYQAWLAAQQAAAAARAAAAKARAQANAAAGGAPSSTSGGGASLGFIALAGGGALVGGMILARAAKRR